MERCDAVVVGGGMAGLTAAAYLARAGMDVCLLEKNAHCGGLLHNFTRDGFRFEAGVRALESAGIIRPMLKELGITLKTVGNPVSIGVRDRIMHVASRESLKEYAELLKAIYPDSAGDVDRVTDVIRRVMRDMRVLYGVSNPLFNDFRNNPPYFIKVYVPWFFKFLLTLLRIRRMQQPVESYLETVVRNRSLRDIISQHFFRNTPTFFAMSYFYLYSDYFYPMGGVCRLPQVLQEKILEYGGKVMTATEIVEIHASERQVVDRRGTRYAYRNLIWAADMKTLYRQTNTTGLIPRTAGAISARRDALAAGRGTDSVFTVYAAVDEPPETFAAISHGHFFYTPSSQGLGDIHRSRLKELLLKEGALSPPDVRTWLEAFCELNTYEISIPVLKDPSAAAEGKTGLIISTLFEYELVRRVQESGWYDAFREEVERNMLDVLSASIYPALKDRLLFRFSATPLTIEEMVGSSEGSIVGWSFEDPIPATSQMLQVNDSVKTLIPGVTQAGQWCYSPAGVPTAILTGRLAADALLRNRNRTPKGSFGPDGE